MSDEPKYRDEEWLRGQYWESGKSTVDIADECGCGNETVRRWMKRHGIERRSVSPPPDVRLTDEEWLREQYWENKKTTRDIADECGCCKASVRRWMKRHGIERRSVSPPPDDRLTDEEWLREQYWESGKSTVDIADECGCAASTAHNWMERHGIERRGVDRLSDVRLTDEEWLREQYWENEKTAAEIADGCGCSARTILNWMDRHGIERRSAVPRPPDGRLTNEKWLREQYWKNKKTVADIADVCGCGDMTVHRWMERHGVERRRTSPIPDDRLTDEEWLREQYWESGKSTVDIADECECDGETVSSWMKRHGIGLRDISGTNHPNWNGGPQAYGPGWNTSKRRQVRERDGYECVDCGTTQAEHKAEYNQKLHVHHLIKARDIDDPEERNAPENLITLCRDCHREWERLSEAGIRPQIDGVTAD